MSLFPLMRTMLTQAQNNFATWRNETLAPLKFPVFRNLWLATVSSSIGGVIQAVGASWLMTTLTSDQDMVAFVQAAALAPMMFLALPAGALADIADRRRLMLVSQISGAAAASGLCALALLGHATPQTLLGFTLLIGAAQALHLPAWQAALEDVVDRADLPAAISLNALAFNVARSVGPAIGGVLVASFGAPLAFGVNALSFLGMMSVLLLWRSPKRNETLPPEQIGPAMITGLRYVLLSPSLLAIVIRGGLFGICGSSVLALLPLIAKERLGGGPMTYGLLLAGFGAGSMIAALGGAKLRQSMGPQKGVAVATMLFAAATLGLAFSQSTILSIVILMCAGASWITALTTIGTSLQMSCPRWVVGRGVAIGQVTTIGGMSIGSAVWGILAKQTSVVESLVISGLAMLATILAARRLPLPASSPVDFRASDHYKVPSPGTPLDERAGPIIVLVEYQVAARDAPAFLEAIHDLGRARQRDGARRWSIRQDIDNPEIWTERYQSPTWIDHLRRVSRFTIADQALRDRVMSLQQGTPKVRRLLERPPETDPIGVSPAID